MVLISLELTNGAVMSLGFSNSRNVDKFKINYEEEVKKTNEGIMKVYKHMFRIDLDALALIRYYMKVERRLFHIVYKGETFKCLNDVQFQLNSLTRYEN